MPQPEVSVVIPAHNAETTLGDTVRSALTQTVEDLEVVVVDDGSSDGTVAVAEAFDDPRVHVVGQANAGAAAARNTGLHQARGTYVALLDADDLWLPEKLERQLEVLRDTGVRAVQCGAYRVDNDLRVIEVRPCRRSVNPLLETLRFQNMPANMTALVMDRQLTLELGGFDPSLEILEEWDMHLKAVRYMGLRSIEEPLILIRVHPGNRSRNLAIHIAPGHAVLEGIFADPDLPADVRRRRREIYARFYTMLAGGSLRSGDYGQLAKWAARVAMTDPRRLSYFLALPARRVRRRRSVAGYPGSFRLEHGRPVAI